jgi:hypothetical protein
MFNRLLDPEGSKRPRLADLAPQVGTEVQRLGTLSYAQLATEVMTKAFDAEYRAGSGLQELGSVADSFLPDYAPPRLGDTTPVEVTELVDLVAEGVQVLEQARLIRPSFDYSGNPASWGWVTTRLGRSAIAGGTVASALGQG